MKEQEILQLQQNSLNKSLYIQKVGTHFHAYGNAAFALAKLLQLPVYKLRLSNQEDSYRASFPFVELEGVILKMNEAGWTCKICNNDVSLISFQGADGTPDMSLVVEGVVREENRDSSVHQKVVCLYETFLKELPKEDKLKLIILLAASVSENE